MEHLYIKRDDLIHPVVSGNKWRKLHLHVHKAKANGFHSLLTFGGAYSNHLLATACAGQLLGFKTIGVVRGNEFKSHNAQLSLCKQYGMHLHFITRERYSNKNSINWNTQFKNTYLIEEGGRGVLAAKGCHTIIQELKTVYDYICLPVGTATTLLGICDALDEQGINTKVLAFSALKRNESDQLKLSHHKNRIQWFDEDDFGGYGKYNKELLLFINNFIKETGVLIDPIYQGKMYFKLNKLVQSGYFSPVEKVLCLHTGGNLGLYTKKTQRLLLS